MKLKLSLNISSASRRLFEKDFRQPLRCWRLGGGLQIGRASCRTYYTGFASANPAGIDKLLPQQREVLQNI